MQLNQSKSCLDFLHSIVKFLQSCFIYFLSKRKSPSVRVFIRFCLCYCLHDMITRQEVFNVEPVNLNTFTISQCIIVRLNILLFVDLFQFLNPSGINSSTSESKTTFLDNCHNSNAANRYIISWLAISICVYLFSKSISIVFEAANQENINRFILYEICAS